MARQVASRVEHWCPRPMAISHNHQSSRVNVIAIRLVMPNCPVPKWDQNCWHHQWWWVELGALEFTRGLGGAQVVH